MLHFQRMLSAMGEFLHFERFNRITYFVSSGIIFIIRYMENGRMESFGKQILQAVCLFLRGHVSIFSDKFSHIDRLSKLHTDSRTEAEEIAVLDSHRYDIERYIRHQVMSLIGNSEYTFRQRQGGIFSLMRAFWEDTERYPVLQYIDRLIYRLLILLDRTDTVTLTHDRHDFQESENLSQFAVSEDIGTCHEHLRLAVVGQYHQGIHQRIGMIRCKNDSPIFRNVLFPYLKNASIRLFDRKTYIIEKHTVQSVVILYFLDSVLAHALSFLRK